MNNTSAQILALLIIVAGLLAALYVHVPARLTHLFSQEQILPPTVQEPILAVPRTTRSTPSLPATSTSTALDTHTVIQTPSVQNGMLQYIEVIDSCASDFSGTCVNMRSGPGTQFPVVLQLRTGIVLQVAQATTTRNGQTWYEIIPDTSIRYPERIASKWYVAAYVVQPFFESGDQELASKSLVTSSKRIVIDRSEQKLYAYDGDELFLETSVSTGLDLTPTPRGTFTVYRKTPSRYMQGPLPGVSTQYYDLPGVPWDLYFTEQGGAIHGAYWHNKFGQQWSHGCVNVPLQTAHKLYDWAEIGMHVTVRD